MSNPDHILEVIVSPSALSQISLAASVLKKEGWSLTRFSIKSNDTHTDNTGALVGGFRQYIFDCDPVDNLNFNLPFVPSLLITVDATANELLDTVVNIYNAPQSGDRLISYTCQFVELSVAVNNARNLLNCFVGFSDLKDGTTISFYNAVNISGKTNGKIN